MKKYELVKTDFQINMLGKKMYRIKALVDFGFVKKNELGGYIEREENLSHDGNAWVYGDAQVFDDALVFGNARVFDDARVYGNAQVFDDARVYGDAQVFDDALVFGNAQVFDDALVFGNAQVFDDALVYGNARVFDDAWVCGNARVFGDAWVSKKVINIIGLKFNITICDNSIQVGCKFYLKKDIDNIKYESVKNECSLEEFKFFKKLIKSLI